MKRLLVPSMVALILLLCGCLLEGDMSLTEILLLSEFYDPNNYTVIKGDILGDDQTVMFYIEIRDFKYKKVGEEYEFWVSVDISIGDEFNNTYVEEIDEKEIHITNLTEKPGMVWYTYAWFTGNMVRSGTYWVKITIKDKLSDRIAYQRKEFYVDLSRKFG